jgi:UDP-N-acetylglucosamine diphosphorylase / glucose-1-phosphate thymidylyltransferase / UDP-N-acetylgalactosamine diphosphorylase / glucosamine-1-phosphate N-acetyltransferase / galactosamine-1-phosphate N-acetyltransferase
MSLHLSEFFDLSLFEQAPLFKNITHPWEVLPLIESYLQELSLGRIEGEVSSRAYLVHPELIYIGEGTVVEPGAYIQGPCWIGKNCVVRHGAYIRGNLITGNKCVIGHDTEVKNAIFLNEAHAAHFAYVGDSILGNGVNLGAGTKCANFKLDKQPINIHYENKRIPTQLRKLGAIIGDRSQIGCNSVTNPGTLIGKEVLCYPCLNMGGYIPSRSIIKSSAGLIVSSY